MTERLTHVSAYDNSDLPTYGEHTDEDDEAIEFHGLE